MIPGDYFLPDPFVPARVYCKQPVRDQGVKGQGRVHVTQQHIDVMDRARHGAEAACGPLLPEL